MAYCTQTVSERLDYAGIPYAGVDVIGGAVVVTFAPSATPAQITRGNAIAALVPVGYRSQRLFKDVLANIVALSAGQLTNLQANLFTSGLYTTEAGPSLPGMVALDTAFRMSAATTADKNLIQQRAAALWVMDHLSYLFQPPWDLTIQVAGDAPA